MAASWAFAVAAAILVGEGTAALANPASSTRPPSLCTPREEVVFGCAQGHKVISLCADTESGRTRLRYVYGTQSKIELEVSQAARPDAFTSGVAGLAGGGIDFVRVRNGDFAYVVYTGLTPGWEQDGWIVEAHGSAITHHICKRAATGSKVWGPVYSAKLPRASDSRVFLPPAWVGAAPSERPR